MTSYHQWPSVPPSVERPRGGGVVGTAGVLAFIGALVGLALVGLGLSGLSDGDDSAATVWQLVVGLVEVATLLAGSMVLLMWREPGRWLVLTGCLVHLAATEVFVFAQLSSLPGLRLPEFTGLKLVSGLVDSAPAVATGVLVVLPITGRYLAWKRTQPRDDLS